VLGQNQAFERGSVNQTAAADFDALKLVLAALTCEEAQMAPAETREFRGILERNRCGGQPRGGVSRASRLSMAAGMSSTSA